MKATIVNERRFTITLDDGAGGTAVYKGCVRGSEWNGLTEFMTPDGAKIVVRCEQDLAHVLDRFFGDDSEANGEVVVVSPRVVEHVARGGR